VILDEGESGKSLDRPGLRCALERIAAGEADALVAAKLDRISRSVGDFAALLEWFTQAGAFLVALDLGVDTSTPGGRPVSHVFASVAEWERDIIAARTRDGLVALRAKGGRVGRPAVAEQGKLAARIRRLRERGWTYQRIAGRFSAEGVPTVRGGSEWRVSSVQFASGYRRPRARAAKPDLPKVKRRRR
jgi:DNA invertase Pin-like site-specific DNA recombinase